MLNCEQCGDQIKPDEKIFELAQGHVVNLTAEPAKVGPAISKTSLCKNDDVHGLNVDDTLYQWCETCEDKRGELFPPIPTAREQALVEALESATNMLEDYDADTPALDGFYAVIKEN